MRLHRQQPFPVTSRCCRCCVPDYEMQHLFEGGYYFASLFVMCGINSKVATKRGATFIRANMVTMIPQILNPIDRMDSVYIGIYQTTYVRSCYLAIGMHYCAGGGEWGWEVGLRGFLRIIFSTDYNGRDWLWPLWHHRVRARVKGTFSIKELT